MTIFLSILFFYFGAAIGSFLSTVIYRLKTGKSGTFFGRSMCPHCERELRGLDLIPLASFAFLKGRCRYCEKPIPKHYLFIELLTGLVFAALFLKFNFFSLQTQNIYWDINETNLVLLIFNLVIASFLIAIFFFDLLYREIPDQLSVPLIAVALVGNFIFKTLEPADMLIGALIALIFFGGQVLLSKGAWMGSGDIRLGIFMGVFFGWKLFLVALLLSYAIGAFASISLLISKKATMKSRVPFGPFLVIGTLTTTFFGEMLLSTYLSYIGM